MDLKAPQDFLTFDPVTMNVVNRVATGCRLSGKLRFDGGLLVQGDVSGTLRVNGSLVVWAGASVRGRIRVRGDLYLFGQIGDVDADATETTVECTGTICVADSGLSTGTLLARRMQLYGGANVHGPFKTLREGQELPVLSEVFEETA